MHKVKIEFTEWSTSFTKSRPNFLNLDRIPPEIKFTESKSNLLTLD